MRRINNEKVFRFLWNVRPFRSGLIGKRDARKPFPRVKMSACTLIRNNLLLVRVAMNR